MIGCCRRNNLLKPEPNLSGDPQDIPDSESGDVAYFAALNIHGSPILRFICAPLYPLIFSRIFLHIDIPHALLLTPCTPWIFIFSSLTGRTAYAGIRGNNLNARVVENRFSHLAPDGFHHFDRVVSTQASPSQTFGCRTGRHEEDIR